MYEINKPSNKISPLLKITFCGFVCSREIKNLNAVLETAKSENTNMKIYIVSILVISLSLS